LVSHFLLPKCWEYQEEFEAEDAVETQDSPHAIAKLLIAENLISTF
jgi:hypothetical protein